MRKIITFAAFFVFLSVTAALFENNKLVTSIKEFEEFQSVLNGEQDRLAIVIFWNEDSQGVEEYEKVAYDTANQNEEMFSIYEVDCEFFSEDEISICGLDNAKKLPAIKIYAPTSQRINPITKKKNIPKELAYGGSTNSKDLASFCREHMPNYAILRPSWKFIQDKLLPNLSHSKVFLFTNKSSSSPLFKALTAIYRDRLKFVEVHSSQTDIAKNFQIQDFPMFAVTKLNEDGQVEVVQYKDSLKIAKIKQFLDKFAHPQKVEEDYELEGVPAKGGNKQQKEEENEDKPKDEAKKEEKEAPKFQSAYGDDDEEEETAKESQKKQANTFNFLKYQKTLLQEEGILLIHVKDENGKDHPAFEGVANKLEELATYYEFVTDSPEKKQFAETTLGIKTYPSIKLLPLGREKKESSSYVYGEKVTLETIIEEVDESTENSAVGISDPKMMQMMVGQAVQQTEIVQIYLHNKPRIPLSFRVPAKLEIYQKNAIRFFTFRDPPAEFLKQFSVTSLPKIIVVFRNVPPEQKDTPFKEDQVQATSYTGKIAYKEYSQFLDIFVKKSSEATPNQKSKKKVNEIKSQEDIDTICKKKAKFCFIALLNGEQKQSLQDMNSVDYEYDEATALPLEKHLKTINDLKDKLANRPVNFGWIDAVCHQNILADLEIQEDTIPNFIFYNPGKKQFSLSIGRYLLGNLEDFALRAIQGKTRWQNLQNELQIESLDCQEEHQKLLKQKEEGNQSSNSEFDDEIQREILEEERKRKEQIKAELNEGKQKKKKNKSKSKKKSDL